jgi:protoglobin
MSMPQIPGYDYGASQVPRSPVTMEQLNRLKETVLLTDEDVRHLKKAGEVLSSQVEAILDVWYGFVGNHPFLLEYFLDKSGKPDSNYLQGVRGRFGQWIRDTCRAEYDQKWLDYQQEIARRHTPAKKNRTDGVDGKTSEVPLPYVIGFIYPITATIKPFLARGGATEDEVEKMHQAWFKSVTLQVALWSQAYTK